MIKSLHGVVHGRTIELTEAPGFAEGQQVELIVRVAAPAQRLPGAGLAATEGALALDTEWDAIMKDVRRERKVERRRSSGELGEA